VTTANLTKDSTETSGTTVQVTTPAGQKGELITLPSSIFGVQANIALMHQVVVAQLAAARQGSIRAPQFTGGGVVHGPVPRDYSQRTPKKMKAAALRGALSDRARHDRIHVLAADQLNTYDVLCADDVIFTKSAFDAFVAAATKGDTKGASA